MPAPLALKRILVKSSPGAGAGRLTDHAWQGIWRDHVEKLRQQASDPGLDHAEIVRIKDSIVIATAIVYGTSGALVLPSAVTTRRSFKSGVLPPKKQMQSAGRGGRGRKWKRRFKSSALTDDLLNVLRQQDADNECIVNEMFVAAQGMLRTKFVW